MRRRFDALGIAWENTRRNASTERTTPLRGDIWVSKVRHDAHDFESKIVALIECKDRNCSLGDRDWVDAIRQGTEKATRQRLNSFFVTNTDGVTRCYNRHTGQSITLDGSEVSDFQSIATLAAIQAQISPANSSVRIRSFAQVVPDSNHFRAALWNLKQIYRSKGMGAGSEEEIIKTTLTLCILKILSERQRVVPMLPTTILLWNDWRANQADRDIRNTIEDITSLNTFRHLAGSLAIDDRLDAQSAQLIVQELSRFTLFGSDFDFFGIIYETFASKGIKKDFGEFYTPRHIVRFVVRNLFRGEAVERPLLVCDPACGTGGFLVETFLFLQDVYRQTDSLSDQVIDRLKDSTFVGLDTNARHAVPYARTNMMMAGDGGAHIRSTDDSLQESFSDEFDYVIANVPYGQYAGSADINAFSYTNKKRYELLFLEKIVTMLKPGGKAAVIVPDGLIQNTSYMNFRVKFLQNCKLTSVVSLPSFSFLPYTGEKTYILFFEKKRDSERGVIQEDPVWHFIVDHDGFQEGTKRFPINDDDLTQIGPLDFEIIEIPRKAEAVPMSRLSDYNFYTLCSESLIRAVEITEISEEDFVSMIERGEQIMQGLFGNA